MTSNCQPLNGLKCHISDSDGIPVEELCNNSNSFEGELLLFCESKHVLSFLKNPIDNLLRPSNISQYYSTLLENYPNFFQNSNNEIFEQFTNIINLRQLNYWSGTSFAIRLFCETMIYANYGTYAWYGDVVLKSKTDKDKIDEIYNRIGKLGFTVFMNIVISSEWKNKLIAGDSKFLTKHELKDKRLSYATEAAKNLQILTNKVQWMKTDTLKKVQKVFSKLSPFVHSRGIVDSTIIDESLNEALAAYEEFYSSNNPWRIMYEQ